MGNVPKRLTQSQMVFYIEYAKERRNGVKAYLTAYKSCKSERAVAVGASRLLTNANIISEIDRIFAKLEAQCADTVVWITTIWIILKS